MVIGGQNYLGVATERGEKLDGTCVFECIWFSKGVAWWIRRVSLLPYGVGWEVIPDNKTGGRKTETTEEGTGENSGGNNDRV